MLSFMQPRKRQQTGDMLTSCVDNCGGGWPEEEQSHPDDGTDLGGLGTLNVAGGMWEAMKMSDKRAKTVQTRLTRGAG